MAYEEISVRAQKSKERGEKLKSKSGESLYKRNDLQSMVIKNGGDAYNALFDVNTYTDGFANSTKQLVKCTGSFLINAADQFEEVDMAVSQEVSRV